MIEITLLLKLDSFLVNSMGKSEDISSQHSAKALKLSCEKIASALVQGSDSQRSQSGVVGQKHQRLACVGIFESDTPQMFGIVASHVKSVETKQLIANYSRAAVGFGRVPAPSVHAAFGASHKERSRLMYLVEPVEVYVNPIHYVKRPGLDGQDVEHFDVAHLAIADMNKGRDCATQVQQRMHLHRRLGAAKRRPIEQTQAQIDGGRIQSVNRCNEFRYQRVFRVEVAGAPLNPM